MPDTRFKSHLGLLRAGKHHCKALQEAFFTFGESEFIWAQMAEYGTGKNQAVAEHVWISQWHNMCYNTYKACTLHTK